MANDTWYVYILVSKTGTMYTGFTNDIERRLWEHKTGSAKSFARRYGANKLVYVADFGDVNDAIAWEKRIKGWKRFKKDDLVSEHNPDWKDLSEGFQEGLVDEHRSSF
jgi:putative endonuclease